MRFDSKIKKLLLILFFVFPCDLHTSEIIPIDRHLKVNIKKNVTVIDISKPDENGLSYNKYRKFNVPETGVVLNNGIKDSESYLAGKIEGNINFQGSSASLIINEVINWYPSDLSGAMEVSGNPASVIIANPNGITCDGCNFIKVPDITLATGKINFKAVNDSLYEQTISHSKGFYITRRDQGHSLSRWRLPQIYYGGNLSVDAANGITADSKTFSIPEFKESAMMLSSHTGTGWLKELITRDDVQWNRVADACQRWDYKEQHLNPVASAVLAVAVTAATSGSGLAAWAGSTASSAATGTAAAVISGAAHSGMIALTTQAAVALAENKGDLSETFKSLGRSESVKSVIGQMVVGGAFNGLDKSMGWQNGNPAQSRIPLLSDGDWHKVAQRVSAQSVISSAVGSAVSETSFRENFINALLSNTGSQFNAEGAKLIGDHGEILTEPGKAITHAAVAAVRAELTNRSVRGAVTGALAASAAGIILGDSLDQTAQEHEQQAQLARMTGAVAGLIATGHINGLTTAADAAEIVERYNRQFHLQELKAIEELADGDNFKKERLLAAGCRLINCTVQESANSPDKLRFDALMAKYPETYLEDNLLTNYWVTKADDGIRYYPWSVAPEKVQLFTYSETERHDDIDDFVRNQYAEYITDFTGLKKATAEIIIDSILMSSVNGRRGNPARMHKHIRKVSYADLNQIYTTDKKGNKIPMKWYQSGSSINQQGMPFEHYIGTQLPAGSKLPDGFKTFDYYDSKDKIAQFKNYSRDDVPLRTDNIKREFCTLASQKKRRQSNGSQ
ncbi:DUF637 domain-containing protein [Morganella morganii]|uniref:DUF637 domain-containing protein n=1 Tax=Morganella morganii TaxID=582 RepID=UPI003EB9F121